MPTYDTPASFLRDFHKLSLEDKKRFKAAVARFVADLRTGKFRAGLRIKAVEGMDGCFEMSWAPDGRAIWTYGPEVREGEPHIVWLAVGDHSILP